MKVVVISLPSSVCRRAKVVEKFNNKNIEFEFLDAIDGRIDNHVYLKNYNEKAFLINRRRKAQPGELGCYGSHLIAWEKCVALNEPIVVLEDDAELTDDFVEGLGFLEQFVDKVSFIRLEPIRGNAVVISEKNETFSLVKQLKLVLCATGYVITPAGARALLEKGKEICYPIDLYLKHVSIHGQLMHAIVPHIIYPTHADSIIGLEMRDRREKGLVLKVKRFVYKWLYSTADVTVNIVNSCTRF